MVRPGGGRDNRDSFNRAKFAFHPLSLPPGVLMVLHTCWCMHVHLCGYERKSAQESGGGLAVMLGVTHFHLTHWGRVCQSNPELLLLLHMAGLASQSALGISFSGLLRLELQAGNHIHPEDLNSHPHAFLQVNASAA